MNSYFSKIFFIVGCIAILFSCGEQEITPPEIHVERIILSDPMLSMVTGDQYQLTAEIYPSNATNPELKWKSSDDAIVTVSDGNITAIKPGEAYVTATSVDNGKSDRCRVTVTLAEVKVEKITLSEESITMAVGDEYQLTAEVIPSTATNKEVTWSSSNDYVATVVDGKVKAIKKGTATITVVTKDGGKTARCSVTVSSDPTSVTGVTLSEESITMAVGDEYQLIAEVVPSTATNKEVTWSSSNDYVATVVDGKVKAIKVGSARITVTTRNGGYSASCQVTVSAKDEPVEFDFSVSGSADGYEYVDLGLSVKWATHNIGAEKMTDIGEYYAWGETTPYVKNLTYINYGWGFPPCSMDAILASIYDTATELWGRSWRMPTGKELKELIDGCTWTWVDNMDDTSMSGYVATSKINGKSIFLPASKFISGTSNYTPKENDAIYWSSYGFSVAGSINFDAGSTAECLKFVTTPGMVNPVEMSIWAMGSGATIRPVVGTPNDFFPHPKDLTYDQAEMDRQGVSVSGKNGQHTYVDLGLPSRTLWATYNVGASLPEEYGNYFAWGETAPKNEYTMENYKFFSGYSPIGPEHYVQLTKYVWDKDFGKVDGKYVLENADDAAYVNWGSDWHMPTIEQVEELAKYCLIWRQDITINGKQIIGFIIMSMINENFLYLPAAGWEYSEVPNDHMFAWYWTSEVSPAINTRATFMLEKGDGFHSSLFCDKIEGTGREQGLPIRAVTKKR